jgi:hypothetical protein
VASDDRPEAPAAVDDLSLVVGPGRVVGPGPDVAQAAQARTSFHAAVMADVENETLTGRPHKGRSAADMPSPQVFASQLRAGYLLRDAAVAANDATARLPSRHGPTAPASWDGEAGAHTPWAWEV